MSSWPRRQPLGTCRWVSVSGVPCVGGASLRNIPEREGEEKGAYIKRELWCCWFSRTNTHCACTPRRRALTRCDVYTSFRRQLLWLCAGVKQTPCGTGALYPPLRKAHAVERRCCTPYVPHPHPTLLLAFSSSTPPPSPSFAEQPYRCIALGTPPPNPPPPPSSAHTLSAHTWFATRPPTHPPFFGWHSNSLESLGGDSHIILITSEYVFASSFCSVSNSSRPQHNIFVRLCRRRSAVLVLTIRSVVDVHAHTRTRAHH